MEHDARPLLDNLRMFVAFARKRLGDSALAEDVVQDCLLKALRSARKPARDEEMITWFYRILRRAIIDVYRRRDASARTLSRFENELPEQPDAHTRRDLCQCFKRLLPEIPDGYRDVLHRLDLDGEAPAEVAAALGITVNNLQVRLHRARQHLRKKLESTCQACSKHGCLDCTCKPAD